MARTLLLYFSLVLLTSVEEMNFCAGPEDILTSGSSAGDARRCFDDKSGKVNCPSGKCSGDKVCRTGNAEGDVACLVQACQVECGSLENCMGKCLSLDECNTTTENAAFYINCVRNLRGIGLWTAYGSIIWPLIIVIAICGLVICFTLVCYCICKMEDKAFNAAVKKNPNPPATANTANYPEVSLQGSPKLVVPGPQRNPSATSVGPATAKTASSPQITAA